MKKKKHITDHSKHATAGENRSSAPDRSYDSHLSTRKHLSSIVESAHDAIITIDTKCTIVFANSAAGRIFGHSRRKLLGMHFTLLMPEPCRKEHEWAFEKLSRGCAPRNLGRCLEMTGLRATGEEFPIELSLSKWSSGSESFFTAIIRDVTEQSTRKKELENAKEQYRIISELLSDYAFSATMDHNGILSLEWISDGFTKLTGYTSEEWESMGGTQALCHPDDLPIVKRRHQRFRDGEDDYSEFRIVTKSGDIRWMATDGHPLRDPDSGQVIRIIGAGSDITDQKRAAQELLDRENELRRLISNLPGIVYKCKNDRDRTMEYLSEGCKGLTGYAPEELLGSKDLSYADLIHPDDREAVWVDVQSAIAKKGSFTLNYRIVTKSGSVRWVWERGAGVFSPDGEFARLEGFITDVSELKRAEKSARETSALLTAAQQVAHIGFLAWHLKDNSIELTPEARHIHGLPSSITLTTPDLISRVVHPEDRERVSALLQKAAAGKAQYDIDHRVVWPDGEVRWIHAQAKIVHDEKGSPVQLLGSVVDITERKHQEEVLNLQKEALESSSNMVIITDQEGSIEWVNRAFTNLTGYDISDIRGKTPRVLKSGIHPGGFYKDLWDMITAGKQWKGRITNRYKDGSLHTEEMTITPVMGAMGTVQHFVAIKVDITKILESEKDRDALAEQVRQLQKLESLGTLASGVAHDFNNILGIILGNISILDMMRSDEKEFQSGIEAITKASRRGAALVKQLLQFARKTETKLEAVDINQAVIDAQKLLRQLLPKTIDIRAELKNDIPLIRADQGQIEQILLNLGTNARDAMPSGGELRLSTSVLDKQGAKKFAQRVTHDEYVIIRVADTGIGMDADTMNKAFEPFYTTKETGKGTGLGLSIVHGIISAHDGFVRIDSKKGEGTTVTLLLPLIASTSEGRIEPETETSLRSFDGSETILIVEDEGFIRSVLRRSLSAKGYTILEAADGHTAMDVFREHQKEIDLILSDIGLPGMSGVELFVSVRKERADIPVVLASGYIEPDVKSELYKEGLNAFIMKPYKAEEVLSVVRSVLDSQKTSN